MRHYGWLALWFGCGLSSCANQGGHQEHNVSYVIVVGDGIDLPDGNVYLTTVAARARVIDTATARGGGFRFELPEDTEPFKACIAYRDSNRTMQLVRFVGRDDEDRIDWAKSSDFFIVEEKETALRGYSDHHRLGTYAEVVDGHENRLLFKYDYNNLAKVQFGGLESYEEGVERTAKFIKFHPNSFMLMERLFWNRAQYRKADLETLLAKFDQTVQRSVYAYNLNVYLNHCPDNYDPMQAIPLLSMDGSYVGGYDRRKPLNMLIFSLHAADHDSALLLHYLPTQLDSVKSPNLHVVDICIHGFKRIWEGRERKWQSPFEQLYVPGDAWNLIFHRYDMLDFTYTDDEIPYIVFTDDAGNILKRFNGFKRDVTIPELQRFITSYLDSI